MDWYVFRATTLVVIASVAVAIPLTALIVLAFGALGLGYIVPPVCP